MTNVYSVPDKNVFLDITDDHDTILMTIEFEGGKSETVRLDPDDLARELITASPAFARSIGKETQKAILAYFAEHDFPVDSDTDEP